MRRGLASLSMTEPTIPKALTAAILVALSMGQTQADCQQENINQNIKLRNGENVQGPDQSDNRTFFLNTDSSIDRLSLGPQKVICDWRDHPNRPQAFELAKQDARFRDGIDGDAPDLTPTHVVTCRQPTTLAGIFEDYGPLVGAPPDDPGWRPWTPEAYSVHDIGEFSAPLDRDLFLGLIRSKFQEQTDERLGAETPAGEDVVLWLDFIFGLEPHSQPVLLWTDYTARGLGHEVRFPHDKDEAYGVSEIILEVKFRASGALAWRWDLDWIGDSFGARALAGGIQSTLLIVGGTIFPPLWLVGDCDKARDLRMHLRGKLVATVDGGVGLDLNTSDTCGADQRQPCTWTRINQWNATRIYCNNTVKPTIERQFTEAAIAGLADDEGAPRNLINDAEGRPLVTLAAPVERVAMTADKVHLVHLERCDDDRVLCEELRGRIGVGGLRHNVDPDQPNVTLTAAGIR